MHACVYSVHQQHSIHSFTAPLFLISLSPSRFQVRNIKFSTTEYPVKLIFNLQSSSTPCDFLFCYFCFQPNTWFTLCVYRKTHTRLCCAKRVSVCECFCVGFNACSFWKKKGKFKRPTRPSVVYSCCFKTH